MPITDNGEVMEHRGREAQNFSCGRVEVLSTGEYEMIGLGRFKSTDLRAWSIAQW